MRRRYIEVALALATTLAASACCELFPAICTVQSTLEQKIAAAINTINLNSASWQTEIDRLMQGLTDEERRLVGSTLPNLAADATAAVGSEAKCSVDFIGLRVSAGLTQILAQLKNQPPPPRQPPFVCSVTPREYSTEICDLSTHVYGFDLDQAGMTVEVEHGGGQISDATRYLATTSRYLLTVNTSANGVHLRHDDHALAVKWNGAPLSRINVVAPPPRVVTQPPKPEEILVSQTPKVGPNMFGNSEDHVYGGACHANHHRTQCVVTKLSNDGHCEPVGGGWTSGDEGNCSCKVHFGVPAFQWVQCQVEVREQENTPPPTVIPSPDCHGG